MSNQRCLHLAPNHPDIDKGGGAVYTRFIRKCLDEQIEYGEYRFIASRRDASPWGRMWRGGLALVCAWPRGLPARVLYLTGRTDGLVRNALRGFDGDVVYDHSEAFHWHRYCLQPAAKSILVLHNLEWRVLNGRRRRSASALLKIFYGIEARLMYRFELSAMSKVDLVVCISKLEERFVRRHIISGGAALHLPPSVPCSVHPVQIPQGQGGDDVGKTDAAFIGNLAWPPNLDGLRAAVRIALAVPGLKIRVFGGGPLPKDLLCDVVIPMGFVTHLHAELRKTRFLFGLSRAGAGLNIKIVDAIYARLPVVTFRLSSLAFPISVRQKMSVATTWDEWRGVLGSNRLMDPEALLLEYQTYLSNQIAHLKALLRGKDDT